jgi:hypothetical protein
MTANMCLRHRSSSTTLSYQSYPQHAFGAQLNPLLSCVSLGPRDGIVVFNNLVVGGAMFYFLGGLVKFLIERSKVGSCGREPGRYVI